MSVTERLDQYQLDAVEFCVGRRGSAVFAEQGTGKTWITAGIVEELMRPRGSAFSALVVVPLANAETTWARLLAQIDGLSVVRTWADFKKAAGRPRLLLVHYEAVGKFVKKARTFPFTLIVYDESQRLKARGSAQSRAAKRWTGGDHRVILSGTPVEQAPQDLWAQFRFALPDVFGTTWGSFERRWLKPTGYMGYKLEFRRHLMPKFLALIAPHVLRITKDEVLDLPPLDVVRVPVDMLGEQRRLYNDLEDGIAVVRGEMVTCDLEVVKLIRQQQVTGGFVKVDPTEAEREAAAREDRDPEGEVVYVGSAKARRLRRLLATARRPVVVFCKYKEEIVQIRRALEGWRYGVVRGSTRKTRTAVVDAFQAGELDALVCQIRAGGVGLDLFRASVAIFYSCTFSYIDFWQAVARLHRRGQERLVRVYLLQARDTVDNAIWSALVTKTSVTKTVLDSHTRKTNPMGKKDKTEKKTEAKAEKPTPPKAEKPKYGVTELAEALGVKAASVRVQLRKTKVPKNGKTYGWNSKEEFQKVVSQLKATKAEKKAKKEEDDEEDEEEDEDEE